ncbi:MAG: pilus assembly protein PilP [Desulfobacterales bacterium]|jgi:type IV pilus assembly protein PilP
MRYLINIICIALLLGGCDSASGVPARPKLVRKKIVAPKENTVQARTKKAMRTAKRPSPDKQQKKTVVANVNQDQIKARKRSAAETRPNTQLMVTQKQKAKPIENTALNPAELKKPTISPKSDITAIEQTVDNQKQSGNVQKAAIDSSGASEKTASKDLFIQNYLSDGTPAQYDPTGKIDPFEPLFKEEKDVAVAKLKRKKRIPRTPLERIDLSQLKLVGIILAASGNRALVEEASGKGYVIKEGTYIGTNGGKIVSIQKEVVTVEEELEDIYGKLKIRKKELKLPKPPGEF